MTTKKSLLGSVMSLTVIVASQWLCGCGSGDGDKPPPEVKGNAAAFKIDLDGDTDHSGEVNHSDAEETREEKAGEQGVIVLPNWDDSDKDGIPDCLVENEFAKVLFPNGKNDAETGAAKAKRYDNKINGDDDKKNTVLQRSARRAIALARRPGSYQLIWIFADLASGLFSTVTSSTPSLYAAWILSWLASFGSSNVRRIVP